ncbi:MAG: cytochrome c oxidase subunit 2 [Bacteroidia bacterium]|jgi:cytochrome c oxidase subunit 2
MSFEAKRLFKLALSPVLMLLSAAAMASGETSQFNMSPGVTEVGQRVYDLHMIILGICVIIGAGVFGVMFYSIIYHRKSKGAIPATFHESTKVEILWTVIPFFILIGMAIPATTTLLEIYDTDDADMDVLITGYQWKWKYEYLNADGENVAFFSNLSTPQSEINNSEAKGENYLLEVDEPLVLPVDTKVRFLVTANDVLHSWWVPALAVKRDAVPGFIHEAWTRTTVPGVYRGQCAELCGTNHGFMPIVVNVVSKEEYAQWLVTKQADAAEIKTLMAQEFTLDELMERGKEVYGKSCLACHGANGEGGLGNAIAGSAIATGELPAHLEIGINGVPGTAMQAFGGQLNDVEMASVVTYQRNAFGNNMGDKVQPIDIYNHKKGQ